MKKLILSISLMITSVSFSQDVLAVFNTIVDVAGAGSGDKQAAIDYFEKTIIPLFPLRSDKYSNTYKWDVTECRISDDGVMILLPNKEKFEEMKDFLADVMEGQPEVGKDGDLKTYTYDYLQLGDASKSKSFLDSGVKYYIFSPYLQKKEE